MSGTILLYGATGYSGRLIVEEARRRFRGQGMAARLVLAGRDADAVNALARQKGLESRVFALDDRDGMALGVQGVDVILNAAGPFALTAERLARAALGQRCHYVDLSAEFDVYKRLDDLGRIAAQRGVVLVCGAGYTAAASDLLFDEWLDDHPDAPLDSVRIVVSRPAHFSRGSAQSALRLAREQVMMMRDSSAGPIPHPALVHVAAGRFERSVPLRAPSNETKDSGARIATAVNLIDTLVASRTAGRRRRKLRNIASFLEVNPPGRFGIAGAALAAPWVVLPGVRGLLRTTIEALPDGPAEDERRDDPAWLLLEFEAAGGAPLSRLRLRTPNAYDFSARIAWEIANRLAGEAAAGLQPGCRTPSEVTAGTLRYSRPGVGALRDCMMTEDWP
jgi:short subunit dehydrogenase-like uncharacterized protein